MSVFVEKEYRIKRGRDENQTPRISHKIKKASQSAFKHNAANGGKQKAISHVPSREVTVKVTGSAKTARGIKNGIDYITREGELNATLYDGEGGETYGKDDEFISDAVSKMTQDNDYNLTNRNGENVDHVKNFVFSPPPIAGVSPEDSMKVAQEIVKKKYPDNVFVASFHHDKKEHPHVHINLKLKNESNGQRINVRKADLRDMRKGYANELKQLGYDVKATFKKDYDFKKIRELEPAKMRDVYKVLDFGSAPFQFDPKNKMSSFITYETLKNQKQVTVWGKELAQHFDAERLSKGDLIKIKKMNPTNVKVPLYDDKGEVSSYRETKRNNWYVENLGVSRERQTKFEKEIIVKPTEKQLQQQLLTKNNLKKSLSISAEKEITLKPGKQSPEQKTKIPFKFGF